MRVEVEVRDRVEVEVRFMVDPFRVHFSHFRCSLHFSFSTRVRFLYSLSYSSKMIDLYHGKTIKVEVEAEVQVRDKVDVAAVSPLRMLPALSLFNTRSVFVSSFIFW